MKKFVSFGFLFVFSSSVVFAQWSKMSLEKASGGGSISPVNYQMAVKDNKLYVATNDGIYESTSANGGDWTSFGLQGKKVYLLNFDILKLALTIETANDDATKFTLQLYKYNGSTWENTGFNSSKSSAFGAYPDNLTNFTQLKNGNDVVILIPTWGNGIWRSVNGGASWIQVPYEDHPSNGYQFYRKIPGVFSFSGSNRVYALDKADFRMQYLSVSDDFGQSWSHKEVDNFFNPWSLFKQTIQGVDYLYFGGENGEKGYLYRSTDGGSNWDASLTLGDGGLHNRRMIADESGNLYILSGRGEVYASADNGDIFIPLNSKAIIPAGTGSFYYSHLLFLNQKLYLSTNAQGIYTYSLSTSTVQLKNPDKSNISLNAAQNELIVRAEAGSRVFVYSVTGKLIRTTTASDATTKLNIGDLGAAVYIVQVLSTNGEFSFNRFVKK